MKLISRFLYYLLGWKALGQMPEGVTQAVFIVAPHTSNWDYFYGRLYAWMKGIPVYFLVKKEAFFWPIGGILKRTGGIPVDRSKKGNTVADIASKFKSIDPLYLGVTPEGSRQRRDEWKKGFYYIALEAGVPIVLAYIDYKEKASAIGPPIYPTGDFEADFRKIEDYYRGKKGKHAHQFNL